jgi:hypothetical protein
MIITRILSLGLVLMFALIATSDAVYSAQPLAPCCSLRDGTWVVTRTGKPASPAQVRAMEASSRTGVPCCALKNGVWVVTRTGMPASSAQIQTMEQSQSKAASPKGTTGSSTGGTMGSSNPAPAESHGGGGHK